jgi:hypothetical protein
MERARVPGDLIQGSGLVNGSGNDGGLVNGSGSARACMKPARPQLPWRMPGQSLMEPL